MKTASQILIVSLLLCCPACLASGIRVDLSPDNGRKDILTRGWENWVIKDGPPATKKLGNITVTIGSANGSPIAIELWKGALDTGATMAADGVSIKSAGGQIELTISGLSAGNHSLVTYHNSVGGAPLGRCNVLVYGQVKASGIIPSHRVASDYDAASAYVEFNATAGKDVAISIRPDGAGVVILNGFEIDTIDPSRKAIKPLPAVENEHTVEDPVLTWAPAKKAVSHNLYLGTSAAAVENATPKSPEFKGNLTATRYPTKGLDSWGEYYWRVDEVFSDQPKAPAKGEIWRFRIRHLAFPEAEGYGRFARGGRGGRVIEVTNLNDSSSGSLRAAVEAEGPRTVVFRVGGTIYLKSKLVIRNPYITIAGQTAPGDGICISGYTFGMLGTHDVIMRYVRIRVGDEGGTSDGTGFASSDHSIIDHCSISWTIDEACSSRGAKNISFQRNIISEALNMSIHGGYVGTGKGHSFAASISGLIGSFHHNLLANCAGRNWSLAGGLTQGGEFAGELDIRNNVVYNWVHRTTDGGVRKLNFVNNYYIPGPATAFLYLIDPDAGIHPDTPDDFQRYYVSGNVMEGHPEFDSDNWKGALLRPEDKGGPGPGAGLTRIKHNKPFWESYVKTDSAFDAYKSVIADAGANFPKLDSQDQRIVEEVRNRTTHFVGSKTGLKGIIDSQKDVGGFPQLQSGSAPADNDHDGIPDVWETAHGLNPNDATDGAKNSGDGYSNLEKYLNSISIGMRITADPKP
jgi:hypothetical protein